MKNLREAREKAGLLQRDVAKHLNVTRQTYGRYETGSISPDPDTIVKLAKLFNVSADYLLGLIDIPLSPDEVDFMRRIYQEEDPQRIAEEFEIYDREYTDDPDQPVTMKDLKKIIDRMKELDRQVHGDYFKKKK